ncbi:unnamed protein product [Cuscuta epithymum]|uniref:Protein kinase domain-containing protein n=1 Tax=Cuscuta epithymum TaxID=186058 RepID=A0AAV0CSB5_9ASTE|nr:unnamed protein product [Cuscuta epithymum]
MGKLMAAILHSGFALFLAFLASELSICRVNAEPVQDKNALLDFLSKTKHSNRLQWNTSATVCSWVGVECDATRSFVFALRFPAVGLVGNIPADTLGKLTQLRVLSLRSNRLTGPIPDDFSNLEHLRNLYLQNNLFSGEFPASLANLTRLIRLDLSSNNFSGEIPAAVNNFSNLSRLYLQDNGFTGKIPSLSLSSLSDFNVSNNRLNGPIPSTVSKYPASAFAGNSDLCGDPLPPCGQNSPSPAPAASPASSHKKLSAAAIAGIVIGSVLGALLLLLILFLCLRRGRGRGRTPREAKPSTVANAGPTRAVAEPAGTSSSKDDITGGSAAGEGSKLVFLSGGYTFNLESLLRASAEVLGKGSAGTSYKAVMEEGTTVVVKRLKDVTAERTEFEKQMQVVGKLGNENVLPIRAYYYSRDEKLLVSDYMPAGSLSALLHGIRGSGRTPLVWESRIGIALSAAKGLAYLHRSSVVHGNIKASNVLLKQDNNHDARLSDYGLNTLFTSILPNRATGYLAPEVVDLRKVTLKSDVYSFGVLVLELLTGKSPNQASLGEDGVDLPRWVQSVVREEWTAEVFDVELMRHHNVEEEMVQLLQIAMSCVETVPNSRPTMRDVVELIERVGHNSSDNPSRGSDGQTPQYSSSSPTGTAP